MVEKKLSKKEQKALAFRKKGKKNAQDDEPAAVPESDLIDDDAPQVSDKTVKGKRARTDGDSEKAEEGEPEKRYKKNRRPKKKNANHTGFILFVGMFSMVIDPLEVKI